MAATPTNSAPTISPAEMQILVSRTGLVLNPGQVADLVLAWRQVAGLIAGLPQDRSMADDMAYSFRLPPPAGSELSAKPARASSAKPAHAPSAKPARAPAKRPKAKRAAAAKAPAKSKAKAKRAAPAKPRPGRIAKPKARARATRRR